MAETDKSLSSISLTKVYENRQGEIKSYLPPWSEANYKERIQILLIYCLICLPVMVLLTVVIGGYSIYISMYIYWLLNDNINPPELYYWHTDEEKDDAKLRGTIFLIIQTWCVFWLLVSHVRAMATDPGSVPDAVEWKINDDYGDSSDDNQKLLERTKKGLTRRCDTCQHKKPDRSHHCRQCERCNLKMDHHCNWIANCVGYFNYKYFFLMVFYGSVALGLFMATFWECVVVVLNDSSSSTGFCFFIVLCYSLIILLGIAVIGFCFFHLWLISNNYTTIEFCEKRRKNVPGYKSSPFHLGSTYANFKESLGENPLIWPFPLYDKDPKGGLFFK